MYNILNLLFLVLYMDTNFGYKYWCKNRKKWLEKKENPIKNKEYLNERDKYIIANDNLIEERFYNFGKWITLPNLIKFYGYYFDIEYYKEMEKKYNISML